MGICARPASLYTRTRYLEIDTAKRISKIGLGTVQFGSPKWNYGSSYDDGEARKIVRRAVELGVTLFDTAETYGAGRSERILGDALGDDRSAVVIATKFFPFVASARWVTNHARASAARLGASRLDLYQVHWPNPFMGDVDIVRGLRSLQESDRVSEVGVSGYEIWRWCSAEQMLGGRILTNQVEYNLVNRAPERGILPFAASHGRAVIAFSPLAKGLLSGRYDAHIRPSGFRAADPSFNPFFLRRTADLFGVLRDVARAHDATRAQIALAWVIHHPVVAAIPGASSIGQLEENVAAAEIELGPDEFRALQDASVQFLPDEYVSARRDLSAVKHLLRCGRELVRTARTERGAPPAPLRAGGTPSSGAGR
jgi:aryl-alcohol dehydrogenase-like predicted oxidoreductase